MRIRALLRIAVLALVAGCQMPASSAPQIPGFVALPSIPSKAYYLTSSLDGTQLAYTDGTGLFVVSIGDGTSKHVADSEDRMGMVAWSGDGTALYFLPSQHTPPTEPGQPKPTPGPSYPADVLERVDIASGTVTATSVKPGAYARLSASPDGRHATISREAGLSLVDLQDGSESSLGFSTFRVPIWSSDGSRFLYISSDGNGSADVVLAAVDGSPAKHLGPLAIRYDEVEPETSCGQSEDKLTWTPDGNGMQVVQHQDGQSAVVVDYDLNGKEVSRHTISVSDGNPQHLCDCYSLAPGGKFGLTHRLDPACCLPAGSVDLVGLDLVNGTARHVGPNVNVVTWLGATGRFIYEDSYQKYYYADVSNL